MTAKVITIAQHKGGAGKTTLAAHLAVALTGMKKSVALIDMDPQRSLSIWHRLRNQFYDGLRDRPALHEVEESQLIGAVRKLASDHDVVVIDTPPHAESEPRLSIRAANLVVLPVQPSPMDVWATLPTLNLAEREGIPVLIVLNRVPPRASLTEALLPVIKKLEGSMARARLGNRTLFASALSEGRGATEAKPSSTAAREINRLAKEVLRKAR